jgi:hypothetical protein
MRMKYYPDISGIHNSGECYNPIGIFNTPHISVISSNNTLLASLVICTNPHISELILTSNMLRGIFIDFTKRRGGGEVGGVQGAGSADGLTEIVN